MAYDAARGVTVLFGGFDADGYDGETWEWEGSSWGVKIPTGPTAERHAMAYDSVRRVTVLFGGWYDGVSLGDTWEWNGSNWTLQEVPGPSPRYYPAMAYDSAREVTVLFGGRTDGFTDLGDTWEWNGSTWILGHPEDPNGAAAPSPRYVHCLAYDSARGVTVLFGGSDGAAHFGDTWEWNGSTWTKRVITGPSPRAAHAMAYDNARGVTVLFGGNTRTDVLILNRETWEYNGTAWMLEDLSGPTARHTHAMAYDVGRRLTVLLGGYDGGFDGETWVWNGIVWTQESPPQPTPAPRGNMAMAYDSARGVIVLFGGSGGARGETWEYGLDCNGNSVPDADDITAGASDDCNLNRVPDKCDIAAGTSRDCNMNAVPDECDIAAGSGQDCNSNGVPDSCDLAAGTSWDCNSNGIPDECDLRATISFGAPVLYETGGFGGVTVIGTAVDVYNGAIPLDLNADGHPDLAATNRHTSDIAILLNDGDGAFEAATYEPHGNFCYGLAAGDLDGDGDLDLAVANRGDSASSPYPGDHLSVLMNNGNGRLVDGDDTIEVYVGEGQAFVIAGDWDNDGDLDLVATLHHSRRVAVAPNDGAGAFGPVQYFSTGDSPTFSGAADFDDDGDLDLAITNTRQSLFILWNNGQGDFEWGATYLPGDGPHGVVAADLDEDGAVDLALVNSGEYMGAPTAALLWNGGDGTFGTVSQVPLLGGPWGMATSDFDRDGIADLALSNCTDNNVTIHRGLGGRSFAPAGSFPNGPGSPCPAGITAEDLNGDALPDVATANQNRGSVSVFLNQSAPLSADCNSNAIPDECEADCNSNGVPDECDLADEISRDCNSNAIPDECDIADGVSRDCDPNGVPDECESAAACPYADAFRDDVVDGFDIAFIRRPDNWLKLTSEAAWPCTDVNDDGVVDGFDIAVIRTGTCWQR